CHVPSLCREPPTPEPYRLSLHDALPISTSRSCSSWLPCKVIKPGRREEAIQNEQGERIRPGRNAIRCCLTQIPVAPCHCGFGILDRKSTRLNSSHVKTSYAVFCLKQKTC